MPANNPSDVQVQPNSTGQAIETVLVVQTNPVPYLGFASVTVGRQVVVGGDPNFQTSLWKITSEGDLQTYDTQTREVLLAILQQMRIQTQAIIAGFSGNASGMKLDNMETDPNTLIPSNAAANFPTITRH